MAAWAPDPRATIVMTAATPMIMPSIVSAVRSLFRASARNAIRSVMRSDISAFDGDAHREQGHGGQAHRPAGGDGQSGQDRRGRQRGGWRAAAATRAGRAERR